MHPAHPAHEPVADSPERSGRLPMQAERELEAMTEAHDQTWALRIASALEEDRFLLFAQPVLDLRSGRFTRAEVLLRMLGSGGTADVISPGDFLPVAERFNLIGDVDRWVLRSVMPLLGGDVTVAVNLSASSIGDLALVREIKSLLREFAVDPAHLTIEISETAAVQDIQAAQLFAERLRDIGCSLTLDDFGTGYGSFTYLKHVLFEHLKIDMQFIRDLVQSETDRRVVQSIVRTAEAFGVKTVAEGVENAETLELLHCYGVDFAQGYFLGRPAPVATATDS
jgi:EAL domain-containing protein (putative c-di-GMP-specific phosphodiesterase class I)